MLSLKMSEAGLLYLQMMKTLSIMFLVLFLINIPILVAYASNTSQNNYFDFQYFFSYFTIGNMGQTDSICDYSEVNFQEIDQDLKTLNFTCPEGKYINSIKHFGFLYQRDFNTKKPS